MTVANYVLDLAYWIIVWSMLGLLVNNAAAYARYRQHINRHRR